MSGQAAVIRAQDEAELLRLRDAATVAAATRGAGQTPEGAHRTIGRTKSLGAYPTVAGVFYVFETVEVLGAEVEGGAGVKRYLGDTWYALNLGTAVPPFGSEHEVTRVPYRSTFRYDG